MPVPAIDALKLPPLTPAPLYTPPSGVPPVKLKGVAVEHTELTGNVILTAGGVSIVTCVNADPEQVPSLNAYVTV